MKNLILVSFLMLQAFAAQASIADKLTCAYKIEKGSHGNPDVETIRNIQSIYAIRQHVAKHPYGSDVRITSGDSTGGFSVENKKYTFEWYYNINYLHAVRDAAGGGLEAVQNTCMNGNFRFCLAGSKKDCSEGKLGCLSSGRPPFEGSDWSPVPVIDGLPAFDDKKPVVASFSMEDKKGNTMVVNMECKYEGTYQ